MEEIHTQKVEYYAMVDLGSYIATTVYNMPI